MSQTEIHIGHGDNITIRTDCLTGIDKKSDETPSQGTLVRVTRKQLSIKNKNQKFSLEEFFTTQRVIMYDFRPLLSEKILSRGSNLFFTDKTSKQYWVEFDGKESIKYFITDPAGVRFEPVFTTVIDPDAGTKCFMCDGVPEECYEVDCKRIKIVTTDD